MGKGNFIIGCDEAGRGAWAGPIVAAALLGREGDLNSEIRDSKVLRDSTRRELCKYLMLNFPHGIGVVSSSMIDIYGISYCNALAFDRALRHLRTRCKFLTPPNTKIIIDGRKLKVSPIWAYNISFVEKGEEKYKTVAGASIIAKVYRDTLLTQRALKEPQWGWESHKGYGTMAHQKVLNTYKPIKGFHRFTYKPIKAYLEN